VACTWTKDHTIQETQVQVSSSLLGADEVEDEGNDQEDGILQAMTPISVPVNKAEGEAMGIAEPDLMRCPVSLQPMSFTCQLVLTSR
jgi:hypothetical protein